VVCVVPLRVTCPGDRRVHWDDGPGGGCASRVCRVRVVPARR